VAERKFLQETNFQEEYDEDIIPERRAQDQMWRSALENRLLDKPKRNQMNG